MSVLYLYLLTMYLTSSYEKPSSSYNLYACSPNRLWFSLASIKIKMLEQLLIIYSRI